MPCRAVAAPELAAERARLAAVLARLLMLLLGFEAGKSGAGGTMGGDDPNGGDGATAWDEDLLAATEAAEEAADEAAQEPPRGRRGAVAELPRSRREGAEEPPRGRRSAVAELPRSRRGGAAEPPRKKQAKTK